EKCRHVADGLRIGERHQFEQLELGEGKLRGPDLSQQALFDDVVHGRGEDVRAPQEVVDELGSVGAGHPLDHFLQKYFTKLNKSLSSVETCSCHVAWPSWP